MTPGLMLQTWGDAQPRGFLLISLQTNSKKWESGRAEVAFCESSNLLGCGAGLCAAQQVIWGMRVPCFSSKQLQEWCGSQEKPVGMLAPLR